MVTWWIPRSRGQEEARDFGAGEEPRDGLRPYAAMRLPRTRCQAVQHGHGRPPEAAGGTVAGSPRRLTASGGGPGDRPPAPAPAGAWPGGGRGGDARGRARLDGPHARSPGGQRRAARGMGGLRRSSPFFPVKASERTRRFSGVGPPAFPALVPRVVGPGPTCGARPAAGVAHMRCTASCPSVH